jgi:hypothetical protein
MAIAFTEEALRVVQDAFSIYEAILAEYAAISPLPCPDSTCHHSHCKEFGYLAKGLPGGCCVVGVPSLHNKTSLEITVLDE